MQKAIQLLTTTELNILEISERIGFANQRYFSTTFKQIEGMSPTEYRNQAKRNF